MPPSVMGMLHMILAVLLGVLYTSQDGIISALEVELRVSPGDNVTLHCDRRTDTGVYTVWFRNCSHRNQPTLVLSTKSYALFRSVIPSQFQINWNQSSGSYDLLIKNVTHSDLGLYYCGTQDSTERLYTFGNITTMILFRDSLKDLDKSDSSENCDCTVDWLLLILSRVLTLFLLPSAYYIGTIRESNRRRREELKRRSTD